MSHDFPGGRAFAFTILDDTDDSRVENVAPIYELLDELGMRTTKTVWANACPPELQGDFFAGDTLREPDYLRFAQDLSEKGFEIAFHNATMGSSTREQTIEALDFIRQHFGTLPSIHANHGLNRENLYWGPARYRSLLFGTLSNIHARIRGYPPYEGDDPDSPYFWGDLCRDHFRYVRGFAFSRINTLGLPPGTPYRDPKTPYVRAWFTTSDAPDYRYFRRLVTRDSVDRLEAQRGVCIVSTHLGKGFVRDGRVDPEVEDSLRDLASRDGWFVPVSTILDHLTPEPPPTITGFDRFRLELSQIFDRVRAHILQRLHGHV